MNNKVVTMAHDVATVLRYCRGDISEKIRAELEKAPQYKYIAPSGWFWNNVKFTTSLAMLLDIAEHDPDVLEKLNDMRHKKVIIIEWNKRELEMHHIHFLLQRTHRKSPQKGLESQPSSRREVPQRPRP